jgi:hypothetical protein
VCWGVYARVGIVSIRSDEAVVLGVDASFCRFQQRAEIVNRRTRVFCGRLRLRGFLEE